MGWLLFQELGAEISIVRLLKCFQIGTRGHKRTPLRKQVLLLLHFYPSTTQIPPFDYPTIPRTDTHPQHNYIHQPKEWCVCFLKSVAWFVDDMAKEIKWLLCEQGWTIYRKPGSPGCQTMSEPTLLLLHPSTTPPSLSSILPPPLFTFPPGCPIFVCICCHVGICTLYFLYPQLLQIPLPVPLPSHVTWSLALHLIFVNPPHPP